MAYGVQLNPDPSTLEALLKVHVVGGADGDQIRGDGVQTLRVGHEQRVPKRHSLWSASLDTVGVRGYAYAWVCVCARGCACVSCVCARVCLVVCVHEGAYKRFVCHPGGVEAIEIADSASD